MGIPLACTVDFAHEAIYGAIEYAQNLGFEPHPDFKALLADQILDPPDVYPRTNQIKFGKDGKPCFVSGPYDDERKCLFVANKLLETCGEGNFDYVIGFDPEMMD